MRRLFLIFSFCVLCALPASASLTDVYIAQTAAGAANGTSCANAYAYTFFNNGANWGAGAAQIGPGTTVHVCGTITSAGELTAQASGTAGNPITLLMESGAKFSDATWPVATGVGSGGIMNFGTRNYWIIDGGTNGIMEATANGTDLANQNAFSGIHFCNSNSTLAHDIEIRNWTIQNLYVRDPTNGDDISTGAQSTSSIVGENCGSNISIHNNSVTYSNKNIFMNSGGSNGTVSNWSIYNNTLSQACGNVWVKNGGAGTVIDTVYFHDNDIQVGTAWHDVSATCHQDWVFFAGFGSTGYAAHVYFYNNYLHGSSGSVGNVQPTAMLNDNQNHQNHWIFNNIFDITAGGTTGNGLAAIGTSSTNFNVWNNTFVGQNGNSNNGSMGDYNGGNTNFVVENNVIAHINAAMQFNHTNVNAAVIDYNAYYDVLNGEGSVGAWCNSVTSSGQNCTSTFSSWQGFTPTNDTHGVYADVKLNANFTLQTGSSAIGLGTNLYSSFGCSSPVIPGLGAGCHGAPQTFGASGSCGTGCVNRFPSGASGNIDAGAYPFVSGGSPIASFSPTTLTFSTNQFTTSASQTTTLTNTGGGVLTISASGVSGSFTDTGTGSCFVLISLSGGSSCTYIITFSPGSTGAFSGALQIFDNASGSPHSVVLNGTGTAPVASWSPTSYAFGNVGVGQSSNSSALTLSNTGNGPLNVAFTLTGTNPADFGIASTGTCSSILAAGTSCGPVVAQCTPLSLASFSANLTETDSVQSITANVALTCTGVTATVMPAVRQLL